MPLPAREKTRSWAVSGTSGTYTATSPFTSRGFGPLGVSHSLDTFTLCRASTFFPYTTLFRSVFALAGNTLTGSIDGEAAGGSITGLGSATLTALGGTTGFNGTSEIGRAHV